MNKCNIKLRLCVFPNDPIIASYNKGEIKERYYNPKNIFDEVHIISLIEKDIEESKVQQIAGKAKLTIHSVGKINLKNHSGRLSKIKNLIKQISPDIIRAYNPLVEGWLAACCARDLGIPFYVSLHTQYDRMRDLARKSNFKKFLALKYSEKFIESHVLRSADKITIVYRIIEPYVIKHTRTKAELLYNRIDYERFAAAIPLEGLPKPLIISVGSLIKQKNHQCIIEAMKNIDANLLIIGNGTMYEELSHVIKKNSLDKKITIKRSVPNNEIQNYYKSAQVFALAYDPKLEGLPIPVMEAMAAKLPIVISFPEKKYSDGLETVALFSERTPNEFAKNINIILNDAVLSKKMSDISFMKAKEFDNSVIEKREAEIYHQLLLK